MMLKKKKKTIRSKLTSYNHYNFRTSYSLYGLTFLNRFP